jgi:acyl-CoA thioester hydrolase
MGVVYHANYFRYFELSRVEYLHAHGVSYRDLERDGLVLPIVEATASYKSPARYEDMLLVRPRVSEVKRVSLTFTYEIFREGGPDSPLCTGRTVHACVNREGKPSRLPEPFVRLLRQNP